MELAISAISLAILVAIAFLLISIRGELRRMGAIDPKKAEGQKEGQTINVYAGTPPPSGQVAKGAVVVGPTEAESVSGEEKKSEKEKPLTMPVKAPTAVKCPKCNMENSSFRNECFNCGARL